MKKYIFSLATLLSLVGIFVLAGSTTNTDAPTPTGYTLEDIYNLVHNNSTTTSDHTLSPDLDITHSVSDIYVELANLINPASTTATYLGVIPGEANTPVTSTFTSTKTANGFTLTDIANLIDNNNRITEPNHSFTPTSGPASTMTSLDEIYTSLSGLIIASDIATGTTYLGVVGIYEAPVCTDFTYSAWSVCYENSQTRSILTSIPNGCVGGTPGELLQSCIMWSSSTVGGINWSTANASCNDLIEDGISDWRLPTEQELVIALTNQFIDNPPTQTGFNTGPGSPYWASKINESDPAVNVSFYQGSVVSYAGLDSWLYERRCVH